MTNTKNNPYELNYGYADNHDMAISGYGLTIESIQHWLFAHHLPTDPIGYLNAVNLTGELHYTVDDVDPIAISDWFHRIIDTDLEIIETSNTDSGPLLMVFDAGPSKDLHVVKSAMDTDRDLIRVIQLIFDVDARYRANLAKFVSKYADVIDLCDYS